ncbi:MAG: DUF763 domain-containing protein [Nitrososphaerales archaeon]
MHVVFYPKDLGFLIISISRTDENENVANYHIRSYQPASWKDPVEYSFAHGGKDGVPFPVNKSAMDGTIQFFLREMLEYQIATPSWCVQEI